MIDTKPLEVIDFTQGITDYVIDGGPNEAEEMDNFFINAVFLQQFYCYVFI